MVGNRGLTLGPPQPLLSADTPITDQNANLQPLLHRPGTIMYIEENVLCKNSLKFKFTPFLIQEPSSSKKKFQRETI